MSYQLDPKLSGVSQFSHQGARPVQEDFILADSPNGIYVVADGFGGPSAGVEASKLGCESIREYLTKKAGDDDATMPFVLKSYYTLAGNVLFNALVFANRALVERNRGKNVHLKGGASVLAAYLESDVLSIATVGICDSWLFRDGKKIHLTLPRSYARFSGSFDEKKTLNELGLAVPLTALGLAEDLEPEIVEYRLRPNDWVLFHTDGLPPEFLEKVVQIQESRLPLHAQAAQKLEEVLRQYNFIDNASALFVYF